MKKCCSRNSAINTELCLGFKTELEERKLVATNKKTQKLAFLCFSLYSDYTDDQTKDKYKDRFAIQSQWQIQTFGGWEGRNGLQKNCFQFGLQIRGGVGWGGAGSATESNRIVMNGGSFIPTETTRAWESCLFFQGDARWVHPSSQANFWHLI